MIKKTLDTGSTCYGYYSPDDDNGFMIFHREDGPAYEQYNGKKVWYNYGKRHREDGPAVIHKNGTKEYCINGKCVTCNVKKWFKERNIDEHDMSDEDKLALTFFIRSLC